MHVRLARAEDVPALADLIETSIRALGAPFYPPEELESTLRHLFGVDSLLIDDGTYFLMEDDAGPVGCGGWSRRKTPYGGDQAGAVRDAGLRTPGTDPAVLRAFYVHPNWTRRGLGRRIVEACEEAARSEGFTTFELTATPMGQPLYAACGYRPVEEVMIELPDGVRLPNTGWSNPSWSPSSHSPVTHRAVVRTAPSPRTQSTA